jgi:ABC-type Fe3+-siderophore transport system permease subunit
VAVPLAQSSFNYLLAGAILGALVGFLMVYFVFHSKREQVQVA